MKKVGLLVLTPFSTPGPYTFTLPGFDGSTAHIYQTHENAIFKFWRLIDEPNSNTYSNGRLGYGHAAIGDKDRVPVGVDGRVAARVRAVAIVAHGHVQLLVVGVAHADAERRVAGLAAIDRELDRLVDDERRRVRVDARSVGFDARRIEVARLLDPGHVGRGGYVLAIAQYVHGVLAHGRRPVGHVGRAVEVVDAVDARLRGTLDGEAERARLAVRLDDEVGRVADDAALEARSVGLDLRVAVGSDVHVEGTLGYVLAAVGDVHLVRSLARRIVAALVRGRIGAMTAQRQLVAVRTAHARLEHAALARVLGDHLEVGHVAHAHSARLNAATVGATLLSVATCSFHGVINKQTKNNEIYTTTSRASRL